MWNFPTNFEQKLRFYKRNMFWEFSGGLLTFFLPKSQKNIFFDFCKNPSTIHPKIRETHFSYKNALFAQKLYGNSTHFLRKYRKIAENCPIPNFKKTSRICSLGTVWAVSSVLQTGEGFWIKKYRELIRDYYIDLFDFH